MDTQTARELLTSQDAKKPSEIGEAVDVLYKELRQPIKRSRIR